MIQYRKATRDDIEAIITLRMRLLIEEGAAPEVDIRTSLSAYFEEVFDKELLVRVAEDNGQVVATSAVLFQKYPASFSNQQGMRAYITNVYTVPEYRRRGISTKLLDGLVEDIRERGITSVWLWATDEGIPLYEKYGFEEMKAFVTMVYNV